MCWSVLTGRWAAFPGAELCDAQLSPRRTVSRNVGRTAIVCETTSWNKYPFKRRRAHYAGHGHNPRLVVHHETEVAIRQDLTFFTSCMREHSDVRQISPDLLAVVYARPFHLLHESKGLRLRCHVGFHRFLPRCLKPAPPRYSHCDLQPRRSAPATQRPAPGTLPRHSPRLERPRSPPALERPALVMHATGSRS